MSPRREPRGLRRGAVAWAGYDLANTIYSMTVISLFFPTWVTVDRGREDLWFSFFFGLSMLGVALTLPYLGLWSDRSGRRLRFLGLFTVVSVIATASLAWFTRLPGLGGLLLALTAFSISNYAFQGALVFYNALLPVVSTPGTRGRISGLGVGLGYVGSFLGLLLVVPFVEGSLPGLGWKLPFVEAGGRPAAFLPAAILFGLFSLPLFFRVRDPEGASSPRPKLAEAWRELRRTLADSRRYPGLRWFLLANFLLLDAIHTAILFIAVYAEKVMGMGDSAKAVLFMLATVPAVLGSVISGWLSDRFGPRRVFIATAWLWVVCPIVVALATNPGVLYAMAAVIGLLLGSLWTTTRPFLLSLVPPGEEGRAFGLYAFCNKSAAVLGPQVWGLTVLLAAPLGLARYRLAIIVLALVGALGAWAAHRIPDGASDRGRPPHSVPR